MRYGLIARHTISLLAANVAIIADAQTNTLCSESSEAVQLNFPAEIDIKAFIDYVSQRLDIKILYDEQVANKKITIRAPGSVPTGSLLSVLESALKMKGLVLVDADAPGWKRVTASSQLASVASTDKPQEAIDKFGRGTAVTQTFTLSFVDPAVVDKYIKPFLTEPGANSVPVPEAKLLIVTDYATNLLKIARWIEAIDKPRPGVVVETLAVKHVEAGKLATQLQTLLTAQARAQGGQAQGGVEISHDERTNQLFFIGDPSHVNAAKQLIDFLDVPLDLSTRTYSFRNISADQIDKLAQELIDPIDRKRLYRSAVDSHSNLLIVTATTEIHNQIDDLRQKMDIDRQEAQSPIRYYKIKNLPVGELLQTIRSIEQQASGRGDTNPDVQHLPANGSIRPAGAQSAPPSGPNQMPPPAGQFPTTPPAYHTTTASSSAQTTPTATLATSAVPSLAGSADSSSESVAAEPSMLQLLGRARITADLHTNTLIVVAEPQVQKIYAELIEKLDQRRPQVLIEAKVLILSGSDDFSFGVEIFGNGGSGVRRLLAFSSYGLSQIDPATGALKLIPGLGFNGTLIDSQTADSVVRCLVSHKCARVVSSPRVLVNDNATGQLSSVEEVPFTSINASQTVATTSFAGFADAGTTITATPRISDDNHLQLDFAITLNSFTGTPTNGVPPSRQTEEVTSQITIPDGYTVIVGGLNRHNSSSDYSGVPGLDKIPILKWLFSNTTTTNSHDCMFVFLRPVILRDDRFKDLKFISDRDLSRGQDCGNFPASRPVWMR
jgi:general secretion pathway protein D